MSGQFFALTPDHVLAAVEQAGQRTTGLCYALNSLENRVYEVEQDDGSRVVAKFYRPGRWSRETILDEHRLLLALADMEIPVCAPLEFPAGGTLATNEDGIFFALFPRTGGRSPDELTEDELGQLGRLLARIHNVSSSLKLQHRKALTPETYGTECLKGLIERDQLSINVKQAYSEAVHMLVQEAQTRWQGVDTFAVHGDCHKGNLLRGRQGWFFLDFDDMATGPAVQDVWLLLPARPQDCPREVEALIAGYEQFRTFPRASLRLVEALRGLRYVHYAAWVGRRWEDPSFPRAFPDWGTDSYWQRQINDIYDQVRILKTPQD